MKKVIYALMFLSGPVAILIIAILRVGPTYHGVSASVWFDRTRLGESTPALDALKKLGASSAPIVASKLKSENPGERIKAAWIIKRLGPEAREAAGDVVQALDDNVPLVRAISLQALISLNIYRQELFPKIMRMLADPDRGVSDSAVDWLTKAEHEGVGKSYFASYGKYEYTMAFVHSSNRRAVLRGLQKLAELPEEERVMVSTFDLLNNSNRWVREAMIAFLDEQRDARPGSRIRSTALSDVSPLSKW